MTNLAALYAFHTTPPDPDADQHVADLMEALGTPARVCEACDAGIYRRRDESAPRFRTRRFCSRACGGKLGAQARVENTVKRRDALLEDLEWIIGSDAPENVARRLGYASLGSLTTWLRRIDRHDLVARLSREQVAA